MEKTFKRDLDNIINYLSIYKRNVKYVTINKWEKHGFQRIYVSIIFEHYKYIISIDCNTFLILEKDDSCINKLHPKLRYVILKYIESNIGIILYKYCNIDIKGESNLIFTIDDRKPLIFKKRPIRINYNYNKDWKSIKYF